MYRRTKWFLLYLICLLLYCSTACALTYDEAYQQASPNIGPAFFKVAQPVPEERIRPGFVDGLSASWTYENDTLTILIDTEQTDWGKVLPRNYVSDTGMIYLYPGFASPSGEPMIPNGMGFGMDFSEKELVWNHKRQYQDFDPINPWKSRVFEQGMEIGLYDQRSMTFQPVAPGTLGLMCAWGENGSLQFEYIIVNIRFTTTTPVAVQHPKVPAEDIYALFDLYPEEEDQAVATVKDGSVYLTWDTNAQFHQLQGEIAVAMPQEAGNSVWTCYWLNGLGDRIECDMLDPQVYGLERRSALVAAIALSADEHTYEQKGTLEWVDEYGMVRGYATLNITVVCGEPKPWPAYIGDWQAVAESRLDIWEKDFPSGMHAEYDGNGIVTLSFDPDLMPESADYSQAMLSLFVDPPNSACRIRGWSQAGGGYNIYGPSNSWLVETIQTQMRDNATSQNLQYSVIGMDVFKTYHQHGDDVTVYTINGSTGDFAGHVVVISWWQLGQNPQTDEPYLTEYVILRTEEGIHTLSSAPVASETLLPETITKPLIVLPADAQTPPADSMQLVTTLYPQKGETARYYLLELLDLAENPVSTTWGSSKLFLPYPKDITEEEKGYLKLVRMDGADTVLETFSVQNGKLHLTDGCMWFHATVFGPYLLTWKTEDDAPTCANGHHLQYFLAVYGSGLAEVCTEGCHEAFMVLGEGPDQFMTGESLASLITHEGEWLGAQPLVNYAAVRDGVFGEWTTATPEKAGDYAVRLEQGSLITLEYTFSIIEPYELVLSEDLDKIEAEAFAGTAVMRVICPDGLTEIGSRAFANCAHLSYIVIPTSISVIAEDAFEGCGSLTIEGESGSYAETFAQSIGAAFQNHR